MGVRNRYRAGKGPRIKEAGLFPLPSIDGGWTINSYYFFDTTEGERMLGRANKVPGYNTAKDLYAKFIFDGPEYKNMIDECKRPSRYQGLFTDRELGVRYIITIIPYAYLPRLWIRFNNPVPYNEARKIVDRLTLKAHKEATKYAKEDGFIN